MTRTFPQPVFDVLKADPGRPAIECGPRTVSRGELLDLTARIASGMRAAGFGRGTGILLSLGLSPEASAAHLAVHALGCRVAPARPAWGADQLAFALTMVDAVVSDGPLDAGVPVVTLDELLAAPSASVEALAERDVDGRGVSEASGLCALGEPSDIARVIFTSGSTGRPKACAHTYEAMSRAYQPEFWPEPLSRLLTHFQRCLVHQPLAAPVMFTYLGRCLIYGGVVVLPGELALSEAIGQLGITATMMHPGRLHEILVSGADLSGLRALMLGGSPASPSLLRTAAARLGPVVWQGYGQAEAGIISMLTPEDLVSGHDTTVGRPVPDVELAVIGGEICVRSPHIMREYWGDPRQTREVLKDGWLHTRDTGYVDESGMLHLTGRAREVIIVNGEVCYAGAIEQVLASHPGVAQAFVIGVPDPLTGEAVHAFILPIDVEPPGHDALLRLVRQQLSRNSVPKGISIIREVPLTAAGKPDKEALRA